MNNDDLGALPIRRSAENYDQGVKKAKRLPVSYEEWEPYSKVLLDLLGKGDFVGSAEEIEGQRKIAEKMMTPEGLQEIINELEEKASVREENPVDPAFESLPLLDKIEKLFEELGQ